MGYGVPGNHPFFHIFLHSKPSPWRYPHGYGNLHMVMLWKPPYGKFNLPEGIYGDLRYSISPFYPWLSNCIPRSCPSKCHKGQQGLPRLEVDAHGWGPHVFNGFSIGYLWPMMFVIRHQWFMMFTVTSDY